MFCLDNKEMIMSIIDQKKEEDILIPVYVKVGNRVYSIIDIHNVINCSPAIFRVGFGSMDSIFMKKRFPKRRLIDFDEPRIFRKFDEESQNTIEYILFETFYSKNNEDIDEEINNWCSILFSVAMESSEKHRKELLQSLQ